ncbi:MAG: molybdopterin-binding protein [Desulfobacterales bacterium]
MTEFFQITPIETVFEYMPRFSGMDTEKVPLFSASSRILAENIIPTTDYPDFNRATMDGYAVKAEATFGASEANPVYLSLAGSIAMGETPSAGIRPEETMAISTGGMLPNGANGVVMREYVTQLDHATIEIVRSLAPWSNVIAAGEDMKAGETVIPARTRLRPQELGTLAALGRNPIPVFKKPLIGIISTGDEILPLEAEPGPGQIRDINTYTLAGMVENCGGSFRSYGIIADNAQALQDACLRAMTEVDMLLISGGSSVGTRDITIQAVSDLPDAEILVHGIPLSPGKPTILARSGRLPIWGLPGQVTSAMIVFDRVVRRFIEYSAGLNMARANPDIRVPATLTRNLNSTPGRTDYIRTRLTASDNGYMAEPILGKSGLIHTMIKADGLIEIGMNTEGLEKGARVNVILFR